MPDYISKEEILVGGLSSALSSTSVNVTSTATALPSSALATRNSMIIQNLSTTDLYIGSNLVTTASGLKLTAESLIVLPISNLVTVYGIANTGSNEVRILEAS